MSEYERMLLLNGDRDAEGSDRAALLALGYITEGNEEEEPEDEGATQP